MYVTYLLLAVTVLVSVKAMDDQTLKRRLMLNPHDVIHFGKWYRCLTHGFVHADYMHLGFNMFVLYGFGLGFNQGQLGLEEYFVLKFGIKGYFLYAFLYLVGLLFASLYSLAKHKDKPAYNSLGASGAVMGILFAYILVFPTTELQLLLFPVPIRAYIFGPLLLLIEYIMAKRGGTNIGHDAHISGAIFGIVFMTALDYHYLLDFFKNFIS